MKHQISYAIVGIVALSAILLASSATVSNIALAKPPKVTTDTSSTTDTTTSPVNGGLKKQETTTTTTTTTTTCANNGGQGPQAANCPDGHGSTSPPVTETFTTCDGVSNGPGKGSPVGPDPCPA